MAYKTKEAKNANSRKRYSERKSDPAYMARQAANSLASYYKNKSTLDPDSFRRKMKSKNLKHFYGMSLEEFETKSKQQNGLCAICLGPPGQRGLVVDHCHKTGQVRDLLCMRCNLGIGAFSESEESLVRAKEYISKWQK